MFLTEIFSVYSSVHSSGLITKWLYDSLKSKFCYYFVTINCLGYLAGKMMVTTLHMVTMKD